MARGGTVVGNGSNGKVLILDSSVTGGMSSIEAQEAIADGYGVDVVDSATWDSMTADQFAAYRAIVLGDPTCGDESAVAAAESNAMTWGQVIDGNIEIIGSDPVFHATNTNPAIAAVTQRAVDFAVGQSGKTGAYISLSCYFAGTGAATHVSLLDGLDPNGGGFSVQGAGCEDRIHIVNSSPALSGIDDTLLSNWSCSVHEFFDSWPAKFGVLAIDTDAGDLYTAADGTTGDPYILAYPSSGFQGTTATAGGGSSTRHNNQCQATGSPVNCTNGEFWHSFADLAVPGNGPALDLERSYSSLQASASSPFGFGWSSTYTTSLAVDSGTGNVQVTGADGSTTVFFPSGGGYAVPTSVFATLTHNGDGTWTFVQHQRERFVFNASGQLTSIADLNGYITTLSYNSSNQLTTVTDPEGRTLTFSYGSNGDVESVTDPAGRTVSYGYDGSGNLTSVTDPAGGTWSFGYDSNHLMTSLTDPRGGVLSNTFDVAGHVVSQTDPAGRTTTFGYTATDTTVTDPNGNVTDDSFANGQLASVTKGQGTASQATWRYTYDPTTLGLATVTDPDGNVTTYSYSGGSYDPASVTNALSNTTTTTYNQFEEPLTVTDPENVTTTYTYDANGNLTSVARPLTGTGSVRTTAYAYADATHPGEITGVTDPNGNVTQFSYDANGNLTSATDPLGDKTTYTYDVIGRRTSMVAPLGNVNGANPASFTTTYTYDALGDLLTVTDPLGRVTTYTYDADQNRTSVTNPSGHVTSYAYDADNELTKVTRADSTTLTYGYDANGNQTSQTDAAGNTTTYAFDPLNRVISVTDPLNRTTSYTYDGVGNRTTLTNASGATTSYTYDAGNQLTAISYSDGVTPDVTFTYTADSQRATMADGTGTTTATYDSLNRVTQITNGAGQTVGYGYDLDGNLTSLTYPNGQQVTRGYDAASRLTSVTDWLSNVTTFGYDANGNLLSQAYPNGVRVASSFDNANQLTSITDSNGSSTLATFSYTLSSDGQVTGITATGAASGSNTYSYTDLSQVASDNGAGYAYDAAGNMTQLANGATQTYDASGQLTAASVPVQLSPAAPDAVVSANETTKASRIVSHAVTTTSGNELVLAFISAQGPARSEQSITKVTGGGLSWSRVSRAHKEPGTAEVWQAHATGLLTNMKVKATLRHGGYDGSITVATFVGAAAQVGAHAAASGSGAPAVSLTTTRANSLAWAVGEDPSHAKTRTPATGQVLVHQYLDHVRKATDWAQAAPATARAGAVVKIADTAPVTGKWNLAAVEITAAVPPNVQVSYGYDQQGNRTSVSVTGGPSTTLSYDQANRLTGYGSSATYAYNGDGLRASKTVDSTTTTFAWDQSSAVPLLLSAGSTSYLYGPGGEPIEQVTGSTPTYLLGDRLGSTRLLTDSSGAVVGSYSYDGYGNVISHTGVATTALQYTGQYVDAESGLVNLRARYYDPSTGQFLTADPASQLTQTPYSYADDNPVNQTDPGGQCPWCVIGVAIGGIVGGVIGGANYLITTPSDQWSLRGFGGATLGGAVGGAIGVGCDMLAPEAAVGCGALGSAASSVVDQYISNGTVDWGEVGVSAVGGAIGGGIIGKVADPIAEDMFPINGGWFQPTNYSNILNPGKYASLFYGQQFVKQTFDTAWDDLWESLTTPVPVC